jgi:hypothetical protein
MQALPKPHNNDRLKRRYYKICNKIAYRLERNDALNDALDIYQQSILPPSRERQIRIHIKLKQTAEATEIYKNIINAPENDAETEVALKLGKKLKLPAKHNDTNASVDIELPIQHMQIPKRSELKIEATVCEHLNSPDCIALFSENALFSALLGLCLWDIIFEPLPGAFMNKFQRGPSDLFQARFYSRRQQKIDARLSQIEKPSALHSLLTQRFAEKQGIANHLVNWAWLSAENLNLAIEHIPSTHLVLIFRRLLRNLSNYRSGLPDLILFHRNHTYTLIEVKGPGDQIRNNQKAWAKYFLQHDIPYKIARIEWGDCVVV